MGVVGEVSQLVPGNSKVVHLTTRRRSGVSLLPEPKQTLGALVEQMLGKGFKTACLARVIREACSCVQDNLESAVEFLPRPRQQGLSLVAHWLRPSPAKMAPLSTGADILTQTLKPRGSGGSIHRPKGRCFHRQNQQQVPSTAVARPPPRSMTSCRALSPTLSQKRGKDGAPRLSSGWVAGRKKSSRAWQRLRVRIDVPPLKGLGTYLHASPPLKRWA
jgi:hypothetical protein